MEAGRDLDAEIARRVFGKESHRLCFPGYADAYDLYEIEDVQPIGSNPRLSLAGYLCGVREDGSGLMARNAKTLAPYSTNIAAAWQVFVWLTETTGRCIIIADMEEFDADNAVIVRCGLDEDHDISTYWHPAPLALCLAAIDWLDRKDGAQ